MQDVHPDAREAAAAVAAFVVDAVKAKFGARWDQGPRKAAWDVPEDAHAAVRLLGQRRLCGVSEPAAHAVWAWHQGQRPVHLLRKIPTARQVLRWQARGFRCVSVLPDETALANGDPRHPDGLSFALHDLCHLEKFVEAEHHHGQVGFFAHLDGAMAGAGWAALEDGLDVTWAADRDYVLADMNGSAIFLFAALKMKLKMAVRRHVGRVGGVVPARGPLSPEERAAYEPRRDLLLDLLAMPAEIAEAARLVSARRTHPDAAAVLLAWFDARGRLALSRAPHVSTPA